jgi:acetyl-CoA carboxylase biotin carboxyl carrier protein
MNTNDIEKLVALIENSDISEIEYQNKDDKIRIKRNIEQVAAHAAQHVLQSTPQPPVYVQQQATPTPAPATPTANTSTPTPAKTTTGFEVKSPLVGTFYRAASPDSDPFVSTGSQVKKGDTLCIVEAMKLMNEIEAEKSGVIKDILVENATPVGFGEILFVIEPN